jgi:hypothetical protein
MHRTGERAFKYGIKALPCLINLLNINRFKKMIQARLIRRNTLYITVQAQLLISWKPFQEGSKIHNRLILKIYFISSQPEAGRNIP